MRMKCLFWSHTPLIQGFFSQRGMMGIALCGTWPEESKSAPISTWWVWVFCVIVSVTWIYSYWSWKWPDPDIFFLPVWQKLGVSYAVDGRMYRRLEFKKKFTFILSVFLIMPSPSFLCIRSTYILYLCYHFHFRFLTPSRSNFLCHSLNCVWHESRLNIGLFFHSRHSPTVLIIVITLELPPRLHGSQGH